MNIWERLQNLNHRWYYIALLVVISLPIIKPWGLPIKTGVESQAFHNVVESLSDGDIMFLVIGYRTDSLVEMDPQLKVVFRRAMEKGVKVIAWAAVDEGAMVAQAVMKPIAEELGSVYGVDWINIGYKPISDALLQKFVDDFLQAAAYSELGGASLDSFEITKNFQSVKQADLIVVLSNVTPSPGQSVLKMVSLPHGIPLIFGTASLTVPGEMPYYASGGYRGMLCGLRGAAEYESLAGYPGSAILGMDAQSAAHFLVITLIILGNLGHFLSKKGR